VHFGHFQELGNGFSGFVLQSEEKQIGLLLHEPPPQVLTVEGRNGKCGLSVGLRNPPDHLLRLHQEPSSLCRSVSRAPLNSWIFMICFNRTFSRIRKTEGSEYLKSIFLKIYSLTFGKFAKFWQRNVVVWWYLVHLQGKRIFSVLQTFLKND